MQMYDKRGLATAACLSAKNILEKNGFMELFCDINNFLNCLLISSIKINKHLLNTQIKNQTPLIAKMYNGNWHYNGNWFCKKGN